MLFPSSDITRLSPVQGSLVFLNGARINEIPPLRPTEKHCPGSGRNDRVPGLSMAGNAIPGEFRGLSYPPGNISFKGTQLIKT
jgi:hypothetical protein